MGTIREALLAATKGATTLQACYDIAADAVAREMGRRRAEEEAFEKSLRARRVKPNGDGTSNWPYKGERGL